VLALGKVSGHMHYTKIKRIFDILAALALGFVLIPALLAVILAIKLTSPGPVLFRQKRLGLNGKIFLTSNWGTKGPSVTLQFDSRMTRIGQFLERTKLDELPQLWNILIGEMSFVGPRPESLAFSHLFEGSYKEILSHKPGIFGPNQTAYRNESAMYPEGQDPAAFYAAELFPAKAQNDLKYFRKSTFVGDVKWILSGTVALVFSAIIWRKSTRVSLVLLLWDVGAVLGAWMLMHWLKFAVYRPGVITELAMDLFKVGLLVVPVVLACVFTITRVYRHPVRYFSSTDAYRLLATSSVVWILSAIVFRLVLNSTSSMLLSASCLTSIALMCLPRFAYQQWFSLHEIRQQSVAVAGKVPVVVCGIDTKSISLCNLLTEGYKRARLVGLISDDANQVRREIHGIEVIGMCADLDVLVERYRFEQLWIGASLSSRLQHEIKTWCANNSVLVVVLDDLEGFSSLIGAPFQSGVKSSLKSRGSLPESEHRPSDIAV